MTAVQSIAELFRAGAPVLVGDEDEDTTFIAAAARAIVPEQLARLQNLGHGTVVLGMSQLVAERLRLPSPARATEPGGGLRLITPISAASSVEGGWSLHDRALTMRVAADPDSGPGALTVPGHVLAGQITRSTRGAAAAALELAQLAGLEPVVVLSPVLDEAGSVARLGTVMDEPPLRWLPRASSTELHGHAAWRSAKDLSVACELPMRDGHFRAIGFGEGDEEHVTIAFVHGDPTAVPDPFVHVHLACQLGDVFGSLLCGCRARLDAAISRIVTDGCGVIVYTQPARPSFMQCPHGQASAPPGVTGLLRAIGVQAATTQAQTTIAPQLEPGAGEMEAFA
jgi:3,4-dihydroxy 2-butanone 4-phosphate synthase/GTP cyclohydrolase II